MKVTLMGHYPPPYGGVAALMKQMEAALSAKGCRVSIFNLGSGRPVGKNVVNFSTNNRALEFFQLSRYVVLSDTDVFHYLSASYRSFWLGAVCIVLARLGSHKIVISFVGGAFKDFVDGLNPVAKGVAKAALNLAHAVVACNSEIEEVLTMLLPRKHILTLSNCFPPLAASSPNLPQTVENFVSSHSPVVCSTGAASTEYGLKSALEAVAMLRKDYPRIGLVLVLTRYGEAPYERELFAAIESLKLGEHVIVEREVPDFISLLKRSDVLLRTALVDGDSVSVREGLFLGLPTVASDTPFRPGGVILFRKGDSVDMAQKLGQALKTEKGRSASVGGVQRESDENVERLLGAYRATLGSDPPAKSCTRANSADRRSGA
ncbi:MAG: glycosyltransferase [Candidatus Eisenbacteria bacterium]|nr:glycosyltransferase [Candidatus Eisenbacteria bacterium]